MVEWMAMKKEEGKKEEGGLKEKLVASGSHFTRQRAAVYEYLRRSGHHPTAEEVYLAVRLEVPKISLATVYKNLEALVKCGAASKLAYGDTAARYDIRTDRHFHTRCGVCGGIRDLEPVSGEVLEGLLDLPEGFSVADFRLEAIGTCRNCLSAVG